jgi:hypothetical protein
MYIPVCKVKTYINVDDLSFHPQNSDLRKISSERMQQLKDSLINKGMYEPILVWANDNIVLSGNQRLRAIRELIDEGWVFGTKRKPNQIPVVIEDVDAPKAMEILFSSNNHHGDWVENTLKKALKEAKNPNDYGFSVEEINKLIDFSDKDIEKEVEKVEKELSESGDTNHSDPTPKERKPEEVEPLDHLTLPQSSMQALKSILTEIAKTLNKDWKKGDSWEWATNVLCQAVRSSDLIEQVNISYAILLKELAEDGSQKEVKDNNEGLDK